MLYSDYYLWLDSLVNDGNHNQLIRHLYNQPYRWQFTLDENRAAGGINLRRNYAYNNGIEFYDVKSGPCSILEMLIALSDRITEIMPNDIRFWFWRLIENLNLEQYDDYHFDECGVNYILNIWLDREYGPDGKGSLFPLQNYDGDARTLDIFSQMNVWLSELHPHTNEWLYE